MERQKLKQQPVVEPNVTANEIPVLDFVVKPRRVAGAPPTF